MKPDPLVLAACLFVFAWGGVPLAHAAPDDKPPTTLNPGVLAGEAAKLIDYGFCSGRQNPHAYASKPVKILLENCNSMSQSFTATSPGPSNGHNNTCGGYAVTFGPIGHLNPNLHEITMVAEWGDQPLTTEQACGKARVTALGWAERCVDAACSGTVWDKIDGGPKRRHGKWDAATSKCTVELKFTSQNVNYKTLSIDTITEYLVGNEYVRKKAKGTIIAAKRGECINATVVPVPKKD
jgi:hypothetical protein